MVVADSGPALPLRRESSCLGPSLYRERYLFGSTMISLVINFFAVMFTCKIESNECYSQRSTPPMMSAPPPRPTDKPIARAVLSLVELEGFP